MEKDLLNFKKWLKKLGMDYEGKINDDILKKMIPPQRRDMWRNITERVLPQEEVCLIKKSILLHKLQKRHTPLMAKVETIDDLNNAWKYEELMTRYLKIQKEIEDTKLKNSKFKAEVHERNELKKTLIHNIESNKNKMYLVKQKVNFYEALNDELNEVSDICTLYTTEPDDCLIKSDYEDSLIKCLIKVDEAKQMGVMHESIGIGKKLYNVLYSTMSDKSPEIMVQTIENNFIKRIDKSNEIIAEDNEIANHDKSKNEKLFNDIFMNLQKKHLELKSKLSMAVSEKELKLKQLKETMVLVEAEVTNQYKLKNVICTDNELLAFKSKLTSAIKSLVVNSMMESKTVDSNSVIKLDDETFGGLNIILDKIEKMETEIVHKREIVCEMLRELSSEKSYFGIKEAQIALDNVAKDFSERIHERGQLNNKLEDLKDISKCDIANIDKLQPEVFTKSSPINSKTIEDMILLSKMINVVKDFTMKLEQSNNLADVQNDFEDIKEQENKHRLKFESIISEVEKNIIQLQPSIDDCKLVANMMHSKWFKDILLKQEHPRKK
ncbi:uncharacterized protein LOC126844425 [Adelges cooleyi]|uniref:uncharacterized protein LOC126844425 n=1 Tax=Adelges cooleyi TaxID=133065 RepID=UPI002180014E|nr:uncharacterized protein LOC126844425 [Adelges cooleyi]